MGRTITAEYCYLVKYDFLPNQYYVDSDLQQMRYKHVVTLKFEILDTAKKRLMFVADELILETTPGPLSVAEIKQKQLSTWQTLIEARILEVKAAQVNYNPGE